MLVGYARVSTSRQNPDTQRDALEEAGCKRVYLDVGSGAAKGLPKREKALDFLRGSEDTLVVRRRPRLGRSLKDLLSVVEALEEKGSGFRSLVEGLRTDTAHGRLVSSISGPWRSSSAS